MGFTSAKTYDLEVWLPRAARTVKFPLAPTVEDFQARRANIRFRPGTEGEAGIRSYFEWFWTGGRTYSCCNS